jgi:hypothetical protein
MFTIARCLFLVVLTYLLCVVCLYGQTTSSPKYEVTGTPICWKISGKDSNLIRYELLSPGASQPKALFYINALGAAINPVGGILKMGWCCNCGGGSGGDFTPLASNGLNMDGDTTQLGGTLNQITTVAMAAKRLYFSGSRFNEGLRLEDDNDFYLFGTGNGSTSQDAYVNAYRDVSGFGRLTLSGQSVLVGVPAGNGYYLPNTRPGGNPSGFPSGTQWFPVYNQSGTGTGTDAGWYQVPTTRTGTVTATTDVNGDITVTLGSAMNDASYFVAITPISTTRYAVSAHTLTTSSFKVNTGAGSGVSVTIVYKIEDF